MKNILFLTLINSLVFSTLLFADEEILSTTDNDDNQEVYKLIVSVDNNTQTLQGLRKDTYFNGKIIKRDDLNPLDLKTENGIILEKRGQYNVLSLKSDNFDYDRGGKIIIDTLYNGITGERRTIDLELAKDKANWKLFKKHVAVSKFHVKVNKIIIFGAVGIKTIIME